MEQHRDQRYGEDRGDGGDKRHLRHQRRTAPKLHAKHGAEGGDGHGNDHRIDLIDKVAHATGLEQKVHRQRHDEEAQERGNIDLHTAHDLAKGQRAIDDPMTIRAAGTVILPTIVTGRAMRSGV